MSNDGSKNTLLLIDGHNLLFQMFYGMPARIRGKNGKLIQATLGFTGATLKMINLVNPTHVLVLFDGEHKNERTEIDAEYKANRPDMHELEEDENPFSQLQDVYNALDVLKITHLECDVLEADDFIASYALTYGKQNKVVICSADSDFFQLINENVSVLRYRGNESKILNESSIFQKYGVLPQVFADFKALCGDNADNIKGAPLVGPKTASKLLNEFGSLENLLTNACTLKEGKIKSSICEHAQKLRQNYGIIKLECKQAPALLLEQIEYNRTGHTTKQVLQTLDLM